MICAIVPMLNEEGNVRDVVRGIAPFVDTVLVVDNGSVDATAEIAAREGAVVVSEPRRGYGQACHAGLVRARSLGADVVLFLDGDGSDDPLDAPRLLGPVVEGEVDLALGYREPSRVEPGAMTPVQRFGNWLSPLLMRVGLGARYRDMPPFKAARLDAIEGLELRDRTYGFTIELLVKAHTRGLRVTEVPVGCRVRRAGVSKVSGTLRGATRAGVVIVSTITRHAASEWLRRRSAPPPKTSDSNVH